MQLLKLVSCWIGQSAILIYVPDLAVATDAAALKDNKRHGASRSQLTPAFHGFGADRNSPVVE